MAKYVLQEMGDLNEQGKSVVYPKLLTYTQISQEGLVKSIRQRAGSFSPGVVEGVLMTLGDCLKDWLSEGHTVKVEGIGTFSLSLGFADEKGNILDEEHPKMGYRHVEVRGVNFKPDRDFLKDLKRRTELTREMSGVKRLRVKKYNTEERLARALEFIGEHGFITLSQYASLNNLNRTTASRELNSFARDPESGIKSQGSAPHKVWVKREAEA